MTIDDFDILHGLLSIWPPEQPTVTCPAPNMVVSNPIIEIRPRLSLVVNRMRTPI